MAPKKTDAGKALPAPSSREISASCDWQGAPGASPLPHFPGDLRQVTASVDSVSPL